MAGHQAIAGSGGDVHPPGGHKQATIAVVWSDDNPATGHARVLPSLDQARGPWAVLRQDGGNGANQTGAAAELGCVEAARRWLLQGGSLIWLSGVARDDQLPVQLAREADAALLPVYLPADSGEARVGTPVVPSSELSPESSEKQLQILRWRGQALRSRKRSPGITLDAAKLRPVAPAVPAVLLSEEIASLPSDCELLRSGDCRVIVARAEQIPHLLNEIGRERELSFRAAGEGTGHERDLDPFDQDYLHLFAYNDKQHELLGAYRLGLVDELLARHGMQGLYSSTLFRFAPDLFDQLGPTLELGRSFVATKHQKNSRALIYLWKGIGKFVTRNPSYRTLLGPVSVSADYERFSRELMVRVLSGSSYRHPLHESVRARNPVFSRTFGRGGLGDPRRVLDTLADLQAVVSDAEVDRKGLPILLREYLKLGGKFLDFNLDPAFSEVIDGLVVVDLLETDRRILSFYMGRSLVDFLNHHRASA